MGQQGSSLGFGTVDCRVIIFGNRTVETFLMTLSGPVNYVLTSAAPLTDRVAFMWYRSDHSA